MTSSWPVAPSRQRPAPRPVGSRSTIGMVNARDKRGGSRPGAAPEVSFHVVRRVPSGGTPTSAWPVPSCLLWRHNAARPPGVPTKARAARSGGRMALRRPTILASPLVLAEKAGRPRVHSAAASTSWLTVR